MILVLKSIRPDALPGNLFILRQNMFNGGMLAIELPKETIDMLFKEFAGKDASLSVDVEAETFEIDAVGKKEKVSFKLAGFDKALVKSEGWVGYADRNY